MLWLYAACGAYLLSAISAVIDKTLLSSKIPVPALYAFYSGLLSVGVLLLAPFGFSFIGYGFVAIALCGGGLFLFSLLFAYMAIARWDISRVSPVVGAFSALFTFLFAYLFIGEILGAWHIIAFVLLVGGGLILSFRYKTFFAWDVFFLAVLSALFLAASFVLSRFVFDGVGFLNGFIWVRLGSFVWALLFLLFPSFWRLLKKSPGARSPSSLGFVVGNKIIGAVGFFILNFAISLGPLSLVNALKSVEYVLVFVLALSVGALTKNRFFVEDGRRWVVIQKVIGVVVVGVGIFILYIT